MVLFAAACPRSRLRLAARVSPSYGAGTWAIYDDETPVGFVMISDEVDVPGYLPHYLWKLLVDERHQRRGVGTATLDLIVEYFRGRGVDVLWTSAGRGEGLHRVRRAAGAGSWARRGRARAGGAGLRGLWRALGSALRRGRAARRCPSRCRQWSRDGHTLSESEHH